MAGDWMKIETSTPDKPEILAIASALKMDPEVIFTKCFKLWRWADSHTVDGNVPSVNLVTLDALISCAGFSAELEKVGWLEEYEENGVQGIRIPRFERHMSKSAKQRALTSMRVRKHKNSNAVGNAAGNAVGNAESVNFRALREEKRREERIQDPPTPQGGPERSTEGVMESDPKTAASCNGHCQQAAAEKLSKSFDSFWQVYPRKTNKQKARKCWFQLSPSPELVALIVRAVEEQKTWEQWSVRGVIPHAATWLHNRRWEDERPAATERNGMCHLETREQRLARVMKEMEEQRG